MSGVVEKCLSELAKLQEKVRPRIRKPTLPKSREAEVEKGREAATQGTKVVHAETTMSELTVFLLMDRFAPW
uniref:Uncharacterized protein n=1 Tax=Rhizophora mucronata TaxID=61149 RepID=A0A2P2PI49_RHIMU